MDPSIRFLPAHGPELLDGAIRACEERFAVRIVVHDLAGALMDAHGEPLLPAGRYSHGHPYCHDGYGTVGGGARCRAHCNGTVHDQLRQHGRAAIHRCWKGVGEVVVPIRRGALHVLTLFAGIARLRDHRCPAGLPAAARAAWRRLPLMDEGTAQRIADAMQVLGEGLVGTAALLRCPPAASTRAEAIRVFIAEHLGRPLREAELADHLGLSVSRCSHVVRAELGWPFVREVREQRMRRAMALLAGTTLTLRAIAEAVGLGGEAQLHRAFVRVTGQAPGSWRRHLRTRAEQPRHRVAASDPLLGDRQDRDLRPTLSPRAP